MTNWGYWSSCSVTCGIGTKNRSRECENDVDEQNLCQVDLIETVECVENEGNCPTLGLWEEWSDCSRRCDGGQQKRKRACQHGRPGQDGCLAEFTESRILIKNRVPFIQNGSVANARLHAVANDLSTFQKLNLFAFMTFFN